MSLGAPIDSASPTVRAMRVRRQHSDYHIFAESDIHRNCDFCGKRRSHSDHITRAEDKLETMRWRDRVLALDE